MNTVYLAGPITGLNFNGATDWRNYASEQLAAFGIKGLSPMRSKEFLRDINSYSATCEGYEKFSPLSGPRGIMTRDRFDATRCDVMLVNFLGADRVSIGTCMEIAWADLDRIPIVCAIEDEGNPHEHGMITEALGFRTPSLDEAIRIVAAVIG